MNNISLKTKLCAVVASSVFGLTLVVAIAHAAFTPEAWQYARPIMVPAVSGSASFVKVVLPADISKGGYDFQDVRILTDRGVEVPHEITRSAIVHGGEAVAQILDETAISGATVFVVDTGANGAIHTGLTLGLGGQNFRRQVSIYSSPVLLSLADSGWNSVTTNGFLFRLTDPSNGYVSGKSAFDFPANTARYLKVVISAGEEGPLQISSARVYGDRVIDVPSYSESVPVSVFHNPEKKASEVIIDLGASGHLSDTVTIYPSDANYSRRVIIESADTASGTPSVWGYVGQSSISGISTGLFSGRSNRVTYPEQKARYIRLSIVNDDNRPLAIGSTALVEGPIVSAIFETRPGEIYTLYYGNPSARRPTYDIAAISRYIEENKIPLATLGMESRNPSYVAPDGPVVPFSEANKWLLNALLVIVVLAAVAGIGWYLYMYAKSRKGPQAPWQEGDSSQGQE